MNSKEIFQTLNTHRSELFRLGVSRIGLFGSAVRDRMELESDLDFLVEFRPGEKITSSVPRRRRHQNE